ncbi:MAG: ATP-binding protein [Actinomycetota bacterium]|nr:ATP-binding protein [Actinomycetota bacterium]
MSHLATRITRSYGFRLTVGYVLVVTVFAAAWMWSLSAPLTDGVVEQQMQHLQSVAQAGVLVFADTSASTADTVDRLVARTNLRMTIIDTNGTVIADSEEDPELMGSHADRPEVISAQAGKVGTDRRTSATQNLEQIYIAVPATVNGESVVLRVSQPIEDIQAIADGSRSTGLLILLVALIVAILVSIRVTTTAAGQVKRLSQAAESMAAGRLDVRISEERGELSHMSTALADLRIQMRDRIGALDAERSYLRTVLDGLTDTVLMLEGDTIRFASSAASTMFRVPPGSMDGLTLDRSGLPTSLTTHIQHRLGAPRMTTEECDPDPTGRCLRVTVAPLDMQDGETRTLVAITDITERSQVDVIRRDFVTNASHELKTPTAAIQLLADSASDAADDGDTEQALAFASLISEESMRLSRLVKDLLDLSRLETTAPADSITNMREAVANAVIAHSVSAQHRGLEVVVDDSGVADEDLFVHADSTDVAVALDNLLDNAIKYTESGTVTVSLSADQTGARVAVSDTGIGIPAEDLPRLFERFYRVDRARSRASGGTGLGLALVRNVAERAGGSVEIASQLEKGSTFTLTLPRAI